MLNKSLALIVCAAFISATVVTSGFAKGPKPGAKPGAKGGPKVGAKPGAKPGAGALPKPGSLPKKLPGSKPPITKPGPKFGVKVVPGGVVLKAGPVVVGTAVVPRHRRIVVNATTPRVRTVTTPVVAETPKFTGVKPHRVLRVLDPSTIVVKLGDTPTAIRLLGVQLAAGGGDKKMIVQGKQYLQGMLENQFVFLDFDPSVAREDADGKPVAYIYRADDQYFANNDVIRQGFAVAATGYEYKHDDLFTASQFRAQNEKAGLWSTAAAE